MKILTPILNRLDLSQQNRKENKFIKPKNNSSYLYINRNGIISSVSKNFLDTLGLKKGTLAGKSIKTIIYNKNISTILNVIDSLTEENPFFKIKTKLINSEGKYLDVEMFLSLTSLKKNASIFAIVRLSGTHIEMYNHLYEKKEKLKILSRNTNHVEILLDPNIKCLYISPSCETLMGFHYSEIVNADLYALVHPEDFEMVWEAFNLPESTVELTIHFRIKHKIKDYVIVGARIKKIIDDFNSVTHFAVYLNDATRQKKYEEQLINARVKADEANEIKTNFLASISHEFRTPLNAIIGYSKILNKTFATHRQSDYIKNIENSGMQLLSMVDNILSYSQIEQRKFDININDVSLNVFFKGLEPQVRNEAKICKKDQIKIEAHWECNENHPMISTDEKLLRRIMQNLLNNALKFTSEGYIRYGCKPHKSHHILFYVKDSGIGIPTKYQEIIFERFTQKDNSLTKQFGGTGIGLAVTRKMIELLNGQIWVESEEGTGSTFYFTLPVNFYRK